MRTTACVRASTLICFSLTAAIAQSTTARIASAANGFLSTLDQKQRQSVSFAFDDEKQRVHWSNLPNSMVHRSGLSMGELSAPQRSAAMSLLSSVLSQRGYQKIQEIMQADELLKTSSGNNPMFGQDLYFISILGTPSEKNVWMLQFGGHHLALNITIAGERGVLTPSHTAAQPALYTINGKTVRPLGQENDKAFALLNALDESQQQQAVLKYRVTDLVLGPGQDGKKIQPEGLKASAMDEKQRAMLIDLVSEWTGIAQDDFAAARIRDIKVDLDETWFAWSGPTTVEAGKNGASYFRVQ